jgi:hypothetical protein
MSFRVPAYGSLSCQGGRRVAGRRTGSVENDPSPTSPLGHPAEARFLAIAPSSAGRPIEMRGPKNKRGKRRQVRRVISNSTKLISSPAGVEGARSTSRHATMPVVAQIVERLTIRADWARL